MIPREDWLKLLELGSRAMSPYNTQPWRFRWSDDAVEIFIIRTKNFFLKLRGISYMSLGHFLENLSTGARALGIDAQIEILGPHLNLDQPIARVRCLPGQPPDPAAAEGIQRRITNRTLFEAKPLTPEHADALHSLSESCSVDGIQCPYLIDEEQAIASNILADLEKARLSNFKMFREAFGYVRFDDEEYKKLRDRLSIDDLALSPFNRRMFQFLGRRPFMHAFFSAVARFPEKERRAKHELYQSSSGLLFFTVDRNDYGTYIRIGRSIQRILNEMARYGVQSHPILSGLYLIHLLFENIEIFSQEERDLILFALRDLENLLGVSVQNIAFAVRVGYSSFQPPSSLRKPVESLFV